MHTDYTCPNAPACNFHRAATTLASPGTDALLRAYCFNASCPNTCFRSQFARRASANLSPDIAPNATLVRALAGFAPPSDVAIDQAARVYAQGAAK